MFFNFESPSKILFGRGKIKELTNLIKPISDNIIIITGKSDRYSYIADELLENSIKYVTFKIGNEPTIQDVDNAVEVARDNVSTLVLAIGGGSVIDTAKAVSVMLLNIGKVIDYLEVIGAGQKLTEPSIPCIAVPTTSGTGAEVTKNSVLKSVKHSRKVSIRSPFMIPEVVIVDPDLTLSVPKDITLYTGMDALTQVVEPFLSCQSNHITDLICRDAISKTIPALLSLNKDLNDIDARTDMSYTSLIGGLALSNAKLGAVHGFAGPIGGLFDIPHGLICAILLPKALKVNLNVVIAKGTTEQLLKFKELGQILTCKSEAEAVDGIIEIEKLTKLLNIPGLSQFGVTTSDIPNIVEMSKNSSSMKGNIIQLTDKELYRIIEMSL